MPRRAAPSRPARRRGSPASSRSLFARSKPVISTAGCASWKSAMRGRNRRLGQIKEDRAHRHEAVFDGCGLAAVYVFIRDRLARSGIDPSRAAALRLCRQNSPRGDEITAETRAAAKAFDAPGLSDADSLASEFAERIGQVAQRYEDGRQP